jgi:hypothetical protein
LLVGLWQGLVQERNMISFCPWKLHILFHVVNSHSLPFLQFYSGTLQAMVKINIGGTENRFGLKEVTAIVKEHVYITRTPVYWMQLSLLLPCVERKTARKCERSPLGQMPENFPQKRFGHEV